MPISKSGVLITRILDLTPSTDVLKVHDVILSIDGKTVDNDGTVQFRDNNRISMEYFILNKFQGDSLRLQLWRDHREITVETTVSRVLLFEIVCCAD